MEGDEAFSLSCLNFILTQHENSRILLEAIGDYLTLQAKFSNIDLPFKIKHIGKNLFFIISFIYLILLCK